MAKVAYPHAPDALPLGRGMLSEFQTKIKAHVGSSRPPSADDVAGFIQDIQHFLGDGGKERDLFDVVEISKDDAPFCQIQIVAEFILPRKSFQEIEGFIHHVWTGELAYRHAEVHEVWQGNDHLAFFFFTATGSTDTDLFVSGKMIIKDPQYRDDLRR